MATLIYPLQRVSIVGVATEATLLLVLAELELIEANTLALADAYGVDGQPAPANTLQAGGVDSNGDLQTLEVSTTGAIQADIKSLPVGLATEAEQQAQTALLTTIDADTGNILTQISSVNQKLAASFFTLAYDTLQVTATSPDGPTQIVSKTGGLAGTIVQTLDIAYDVNGDFESAEVS